MKKLVFMFVAFAAISLASCGNKAAKSEENADSTKMVEETVSVMEEVAAPADFTSAAAQ